MTTINFTNITTKFIKKQDDSAAPPALRAGPFGPHQRPMHRAAPAARGPGPVGPGPMDQWAYWHVVPVGTTSATH